MNDSRNVLIGFLLLLPLLAHADENNFLKPATPAGQEISVFKSDLQILQRARKILSQEKNWNRHDTRECTRKDKTFSLYCALFKASMEIQGKYNHRAGAIEETRRTVEEATHGKDYEHRLMGFNNDPATKFSDIQRVLKDTEKRLKGRLGQPK